jgi:hypothetical protein
MLIVNTSVSGAFYQLHHSPFLTKQITFADVIPRIAEFLTADHFSYFSPLRWILSFNFETINGETMSSDNLLGRTGISI